MKLFKRTVSVFLAFSLLAFLLPLSLATAAAGTGLITVSSAAAAMHGDTVDLDVSVSGNPGFTSLSLEIRYDKSRLALVSKTDSGLYGGFLESEGAALVWYNPFATVNLTANGKAATLRFQVLGNAPCGDAAVSVTVTDTAGYPLEKPLFNTAAGKIPVKEGHVPVFANSLLVDDTIAMRYWFKKSDVEQATLGEVTALYWADGVEPCEVPLTPDSFGGTDCYTFVVPAVAAKNLGDTIFVKLSCNQGFVDEWSIAKACETVIRSGAYDKKFSDLAKSILNYGAAAQFYFAYKDQAPVVDEYYPLYEPKFTDEYKPGSAFGKPVVIRGTSLTLLDAIWLNFYMTVDPSLTDGLDALDIRINGALRSDLVFEKEQDGSYRVSVPVPIQKLEETLTIEIFSGSEPVSNRYTDSVTSYCSYVEKHPSLENLVTLCKKICSFVSYAQIYFGNTGPATIIGGGQTGLIGSDTLPENPHNIPLSGTVSVMGALQNDAPVWADISGISQKNATLSYQWYVDGAPLAGATDRLLQLPASSGGKTVSVTVSGTGGYKGTLASQALSVVKKASNKHTLAGLRYDAKLFGRVQHTNTAASFDWSSSGFEMKVDAAGGLFTVNTYKSDREDFSVSIDGGPLTRINCAATGLGSFSFSLSAGVHTVRIVKETSVSFVGTAGNYTFFRSVSFDGEILERPADKKVFIEFMGTSISCGNGALGLWEVPPAPGLNYTYDETTASGAFPYQTASLLDADYSMVTRGSIGLINKTGGKNIPDLYPYVSGYRSNEPYSFSRIPDLIVLELGPNDGSTVCTEAEWEAAMRSFLRLIRQKYGPTPKIVWFGLQGRSSGKYENAMNRILAGGSFQNLYMVTHNVPSSGSGGNNSVHPVVSEHAQMAAVLAANLQNILLK